MVALRQSLAQGYLWVLGFRESKS